jgi:hypothetical protein
MHRRAKILAWLSAVHIWPTFWSEVVLDGWRLKQSMNTPKYWFQSKQHPYTWSTPIIWLGSPWLQSKHTLRHTHMGWQLGPRHGKAAGNNWGLPIFSILGRLKKLLIPLFLVLLVFSFPFGSLLVSSILPSLCFSISNYNLKLYNTNNLYIWILLNLNIFKIIF